MNKSITNGNRTVHITKINGSLIQVELYINARLCGSTECASIDEAESLAEQWANG